MNVFNFKFLITHSLTHSLILFFVCGYVFRGHVFDVGQCNASCLGSFVKQLAINCFWMIPKKDL